MRVERISLTNFLSYQKASAEFGEGVNVITGQNASGKTNLIDGLYYASVGKSARALKDKEIINWDTKEGARVTLYIQKRFSKHEIDIYIDPQGKKRILVDGLPLQRIGELMGVLNVVLFSPGEMRLVKESPTDRRRFLDISLSQQSKTYFYTLQRYNSLLVQRNKLLKTYKGRPTLKDMLKIVDADMVRCGVFIVSERDKFIKKLAPLAAAEHSKITGGKEELRLVYETEAFDFENLTASYNALLAESFESDSRLEYTTTGTHRDDIKIASNGVDIRKFGSQGQQRSAV
ncbi:MAG: DNA replication and repair protein RecF, partial [Clostridia bacterium]